jgi:hypothetical protein
MTIYTVVILRMLFPVRWITNRNKKNSAAFESLVHPGKGYLFLWKKDCTGYSNYDCSRCRAVRNRKKRENEHCSPILVIRISGESFLSNPDELDHICIDDLHVNTDWDQIVVDHHYKFVLFIYFPILLFLPIQHNNFHNKGAGKSDSSSNNGTDCSPENDGREYSQRDA